MQGDGSGYESASHQLALVATTLSVLEAVGDPRALAQCVADVLSATAVSACQIDLMDGAAPVTAVRGRRGRGRKPRAQTGAAEGSEPGLLHVLADREPVVTWRVFPLRAGQRTLGTLTVGHTADEPEAEAWDLGNLERIAVALAAALTRGEAYDRALEVSRSLQHSLLPRALPKTEWVTISGRYLAATAGMNLGGDWYDTQVLGSGEIALSVGDAAGHGVEAAARMAEARSAMSTLRLLSRAPDELISWLHRVSEASGYFATAICGRLHDDGLFVWSSAGHLPPLLLRPGSPATVLYGGQSPPLGTGYTGAVGRNQTRLAPGDALVLYTDGLVERRGEAIDVSVERFAEQLGGGVGIDPEEVVDRVIGARRAAGPTRDDIAVLVARYDGPPARWEGLRPD